LFIDEHWNWFSQNIYRYLGIYLLAGISILLSLSNSFKIFEQGKISWLQRNQGKSCLEGIYFLDKSFNRSILDKSFNRSIDENCLHYLYHSPVQLRNSAKSLEDLGFRMFPRDIDFVNSPHYIYGQIFIPSQTNLTITLPKNSSLQMQGWATFPDRRQLPEAVLLSVDNQKSFLANGLIELGQSNRKIQWKANVPTESLPLGERTIKAWVYDRENKQFVKLQGDVKIKVVVESDIFDFN